jgi:hypothetical protein
MELQKLTRCKLRSFIAWPSSHVSDMTVPALIYMTEYSKKVAIYCIYAQTENIRDKKNIHCSRKVANTTRHTGSIQQPTGHAISLFREDNIAEYMLV